MEPEEHLVLGAEHMLALEYHSGRAVYQRMQAHVWVAISLRLGLAVRVVYGREPIAASRGHHVGLGAKNVHLEGMKSGTGSCGWNVRKYELWIWLATSPTRPSKLLSESKW